MEAIAEELNNELDRDMEAIAEKFNNDLDRDMVAVSLALKCAGDYGLEVEVMYTAMRALRLSSELSIAEAVNFGVNEWVK